MDEKIAPKPQEAPTHDAQLAAENMVAGTEKAPKVDLEADYAAAQAFSVSDIDRTEAGEAAASAATAPQLAVPEPEVKEFIAQPTGDPQEFLEMAKDINPRAEEQSLDTEALVQKAIAMEQPNP